MIYQPIPQVQCYRCMYWFPQTTEFFNRHKKEKTGLRKICKSCHRTDTRQYFRDHPEKKREGDKIYSQRHPERVRERGKRYDARHPERAKELRRASFNRHKSKRHEANRQWRKNNPEKVKAIKHRRYAREMNAEGSFTGDDVKRQYKAQKGKCYWCGNKLGESYTVDHVIPLSRGGDNWPSNIVCVHPSCNSSKRDKLPHEWHGNGGKLL